MLRSFFENQQLCRCSNYMSFPTNDSIRYFKNVCVDGIFSRPKNYTFIDLSKKRRSTPRPKEVVKGVPFLTKKQDAKSQKHRFFLLDDDDEKPVLSSKCRFYTSIVVSIPPANFQPSLNAIGSNSKSVKKNKAAIQTAKALQIRKNKREEQKKLDSNQQIDLQPNETDADQSDFVIRDVLKDVSDSLFTSLEQNRTVSKFSRRYHPVVTKLSFLIKYWKNPYSILRKFLAFPCLTTLKDHTNVELGTHLTSLTNLKYCDRIVEKLMIGRDKEEEIKVIMSVDAIDIDLFVKNDKEFKSLFIFYALPVSTQFKCFPLFVMLHPTGKATEDVREKMDKVAEKVNKCAGIYIPIDVVDGETSHNKRHEMQFLEFYDVYQSGGDNNFWNLIQYIIDIIANKKKRLLMTDMIHYGKNRRTQLVITEIVINELNVDITPLVELLEQSAAVTDTSSLSKLQDAFPVEIFNFKVILALIRQGEWDLVLFIFPMACWLETCLNQLLDKESRLFLLETAFRMYMNMYDIQIAAGNKTELQPQISIIRALNTIAILYAEFSECKKYFPFARYSTMPQEHFHGLVRCMHFNNDSYDIVLKNTARASLSLQYMSDLGIQYAARTRLSVGGITWHEENCPLNSLPKNGSEVLSPQEISQFLFEMSSYGSEESRDYNIVHIFDFWVEKASAGTYVLKRGPFAKRGRHILTRQISNSRNIKQRYVKNEEWDEYVPTPEEKMISDLENEDFEELIESEEND